jgi:V/A-type H+-transporting ATPase subunit F
MSEKISKQKTHSTGRVAVVGDRELVIGYRLIGIDDTFIVGREDANKTMQEVFSSGNFDLIIASESVSATLPAAFRSRVEESIEPLVLFMPPIQENLQEESIAALAKRVLGISIQAG